MLGVPKMGLVEMVQEYNVNGKTLKEILAIEFEGLDA